MWLGSVPTSSASRPESPGPRQNPIPAPRRSPAGTLRPHEWSHAGRRCLRRLRCSDQPRRRKGQIRAAGVDAVAPGCTWTLCTAAGERYIPNFIENRIKFSAYVRNVAVIGTDRPDLTAIVCIDLEGVGHWAEKRGISSTSYADLSQKPAVLDLVASVLAHVNQTQPAGLHIKRFINLHKDFDADDGEITRTRKLRRNVVETNYDELIRALYADTSSARSVMFDAQIAYESGEKGVIRRSLSIKEVGG